MDCAICGDCAKTFRSLVALYYPEMSRKPRRSSDEVAIERKAKAEAVAARREFHSRKRAEREAKIKPLNGTSYKYVVIDEFSELEDK